MPGTHKIMVLASERPSPDPVMGSVALDNTVYRVLREHLRDLDVKLVPTDATNDMRARATRMVRYLETQYGLSSSNSALKVNAALGYVPSNTMEMPFAFAAAVEIARRREIPGYVPIEVPFTVLVLKRV